MIVALPGLSLTFCLYLDSNKKFASVSEELALFNWNSVGICGPPFGQNKYYQYLKNLEVELKASIMSALFSLERDSFITKKKKKKRKKKKKKKKK